MPQKRNPVSCLYIHSTAAMVKQHVAALLEAAVADHERSTGPWEIEWIALPEIFLLASGALAQTRHMVPGSRSTPRACAPISTSPGAWSCRKP